MAIRKFSRPKIKALLKTTGFILAAGGIAWLFYWLLPVAAQTRLSADHVRRVFGAHDIFPVAGESLGSLWTLILQSMKSLGFVTAAETYATSAALSAWVALAAFAVLAFYVPILALILAVVTPAVLWSSVIPNGASLSLFFLASMGFLSQPHISFENNRVRWTLGAFVDGVACALTPLAWLLVLLRIVRTGGHATANRLRWILFAMGLSLHFAVGVLLDARIEKGPEFVASFSMLPIVSLLRSILIEDVLGAGNVISGYGGESALALLASIAVFAAILLSPAWRVKFRAAIWAILILPFLILAIAGAPRSWKIAHPGWNSVVEDFAENVERDFNTATVAFVRSSTEEAILRYVGELVVKKQHVVTLRASNLFERSTLARIQEFEPRFEVEDARRTEASTPSFANFTEFVIVPNVQRGVTFWLSQLPDRAQGLQIKFLGNGFQIRGSDKVTNFDLARDSLRTGHVRARLSAREYEAGPSIESEIFERYAVYHLAVAKVMEREKKTSDWDRRARGEYYAALKKVEWLAHPYQKVCAEPMAEELAKQAADPKREKSEPLDICLETAWYHESRSARKSNLKSN